MRRLHYAIWVLLAAWLHGAAAAQLEGVRFHAEPGLSRLVLDLSGRTEHTLFTLTRPDRVVVDLADTRAREPVRVDTADSANLWRVRSAQRPGNVLRVVLDLRQAVSPRSFLLPPGSGRGHRLVVELPEPDAAPRPAVRKRLSDFQPRDVVIAIDAGHGGKDPGAIGRSGTREKHVALAVARRLAELVAAERGMKPVLIRDRDVFISLRGRIERAREHAADLFVSIHADAFPDPSARGASVYVLSRRGASSEAARWLAARENAALLGGVSLENKDDDLARVLLDLSQTGTLEASYDVAGKVLGALDRVAHLHGRRVERAGFLVLKSPDVPSILVETGFISNPNEERKLRSAAHRDRIARAVMDGIRGYFARNPPPGTLLALREHVIERGDTLSEIAARYSVSLKRLRIVNHLDSDLLRVGQVLRIPTGGQDG